MGIDLPLVWAIIIAFGVLMYVVMDGFDLGIGLLFPFIPDRTERDTMINTIAPVWDGNETWLALGGAGLMAAFPVVYSVVLSAFYIPLLLMLGGLIFRGVAFEFRFKADEAHRPFWDKAFAAGSVLATLCQGWVLGGLINGLRVTGPSYDGGAFDWVSPFSLFTGVALLAAYALLGATWLMLKTEGALHDRMRALAKPLTLALLACIAIVSIWTPLLHQAIADRWFTMPNMAILAVVPLLVIAIAFVLLRSVGNAQGNHAVPFLMSLGLMLLGYVGLGISLWPNIIPPALSLRDAAAPPESMGFALVGALFVIPFILIYTAWAYYVFRGKVRHGEGYH
ncbi:cytochrome bd ubiquinol oxidase subunit II [Gluconacetobacter johannae DSM 13595]|uniref:Cytochrome d ubiquinol oxidase subunit II n=1 Tax=Gluconacetobacter johannae TaxID=112140 RepID=A0A7W4J605_9PROT|nr:cytochrome d ubiquinol oxidase subunit II [Gluconacetobacter johannae]MBB2175299.1 cytochrome d ubiquinol oxidase subunit II [Gluconacetobacter johannae]GBQ80998.1 cytochrome bd ubiquinol oxidase subunit II [Gluconacetobacter johannae DSM 13595]